MMKNRKLFNTLIFLSVFILNANAQTDSIDLSLSKLSINTNPVLTGTSIGTSVTLKNLGNIAAGTNTVKYYLSADAVYDIFDNAIDSNIVTSINSNDSVLINKTLVISESIASGTWYLFVKADANEGIQESDEANNLAETQLSVIKFGKDLTSQSVVLDDTLFNSSLNLSFILTNFASEKATKHKIYYYLSDNPTFEVGDNYISYSLIEYVPSNSTDSVSKTLNIASCVSTGYKYIIGIIDAEKNVSEVNEINNVFVDSFYVPIRKDIGASSLSLSKSTISPGDTINATSWYYNYSNINVDSSVIKLYFSANNIIDENDVLLETVAKPYLVPCESSYTYNNYIIPNSPYGKYYIISKVDADSIITESNEANNTIIEELYLSNNPNIVVDTFAINESVVEIGTSLKVQVQVKNTSSTGVLGKNKVKYYFSSDTILDQSDSYISGNTRLIEYLGVNSTSALYTSRLNISSCESAGAQYILAVADGFNNINESNENDNLSYLPITLTAGKPLIQTQYISAITANSATVSANVVCDGGATVTERGICWHTSSSPTVANNKVSNGTGKGIFTSDITGLNPGSSYYVRPYAINSQGISYGGTSKISTKNVEIINITANSATVDWSSLGITASKYHVLFYEKYSSNKANSFSSLDSTSISIIPNATYLVQFRYFSGGQWSVYTDPVQFTSGSGNKVTASKVVVSNIKSTSASLSWDASGADKYKVQYNVKGSSEIKVAYFDSSNAVIILQPSTTYEVQVQSIYNGQNSPYTPKVEFTTLSGTQIIADNVTISNLLNTSAQVNWNGSGADRYRVQYNVKGTSEIRAVYSSTNSAQIIVKPSTTYEVKVNSYFGDHSSGYTPIVEFTTPAGAQLLADNITVSNILSTSAQVNWDGSGADKYRVQYNIKGSSDIKAVYSTSSSVEIFVQPSSTYEVSVNSYFNGKSSGYSPKVEFTTPAGAQLVADNVSVSNILSTSAQVNWDGSGAKYRVQYNIKGSSEIRAVYSTSSSAQIIVKPSTTYEVSVNSYFNGTSSGYTPKVEFTTTAGAQLLADNITVSNILSTSAQVNWDGSGADIYKLRYYATGTSNYQVFYATSDPVTLTGLSESTEYSLHINSRVSGIWSGYSAIVNFTTTSALKSSFANVESENVDEVYSTFNDEDKNKEFSFYPNPANNFIRISYSDNQSTNVLIKILDINGKVVKEVNLYKDEQMLDISDLKSGMYFINLRDNTYYKSLKLIVQ